VHVTKKLALETLNCPMLFCSYGWDETTIEAYKNMFFTRPLPCTQLLTKEDKCCRRDA
jgi:hypothetical protein